MKSGFLKNYICSFAVIFLLVFMVVIFGPAEIFFGNYRDLGVVFAEFGWKFMIAGVLGTIVMAFAVTLIPEKPRTVILTIIWGISVAAYIQGMFLNSGVESIGATAEGYVPEAGKAIINAGVWVFVIIVAFVVRRKMTDNWKKVMQLSAFVLVAMQLTGFVSLFLTADENAFKYEETVVGLSGAEQYTVSANENIVVIVLDNFSNIWFNRAVEEKPELISTLKDFTYYNNADSNYYKTYPSLLHIVTGYPYDPTVKTKEHVAKSWDNEKTNAYFELLQANDYKVNVYTDAMYILTGGNPISVAEGKVDNISVLNAAVEIDYNLLYKCMLKMSCYRYAPNGLKPLFNVLNSEYSSIAKGKTDDIEYLNADYYKELVEKGLTTDACSNYFIIQHLNGTHEFVNDEKCQYKEEGTDMNQTIEGIFYMLDEYFAQLKMLGVYDNSTIIICADHGTLELPQPIFFIKEKNITQDSMAETNAPIDFDAIVPTIVNTLGEDYSAYGKSIYDYYEDEMRERMYSITRDDPNYPPVERFDGLAYGANNVCYQYVYTGSAKELIDAVLYFKVHKMVPMADSLY